MSFQGYSTDIVADRVFRSLLRDFRAVHGQNFAAGAEHALNQSIAEFRHYEWPRVGSVDPGRFKAWMQLRNLFKRHTFNGDVYTDVELEAKTDDEFVKSQEQFAVWRENTPRTFAVLQEARRIARSILGKFDENEAASYVNVGRRATFGGPLHNSFLDQKVGVPKMFTCPTAAKEWFYRYLETDPHLKRCVRKVFRKSKKSGQLINLAADFLNLVNVPKSWKTLRSITPLTLIGLFLSYGIGGLATERLRRRGKLNIKKLQAKHRKLARKYSLSRTHATTDLRRASDSVMSHHLNAVLPRDWYVALRRTFNRKLKIANHDELVYSMTVLPMGNGATFPIETLFFYCLIKAIGNLLKVKGTYSAYGDDLIYPSKIHAYVTVVFAELGIGINEDKTFVESHFRESCGGDFYRGIDVRPAILPQNEMSHLKGKRYAAYLYKVANGLRARWRDEEIPSTIQWLLTELSVTQRIIYPVPLHFPATSGWKTKDPVVQCGGQLTLSPRIPWYQPWYVPKISFKHGRVVISFKSLGQTTPELRPVEDEEMYYWDSLRAISLRGPGHPDYKCSPKLVPRRRLGWWWKQWLAELPTREQEPESHSVFRWLHVKRDGKRLRVIAEPSKKGGGFAVVDKVQSIEFWMQDSVH